MDGNGRRALAVVVVALMLVSVLPLPPAAAAEVSIKVRDPDGGETVYAGAEYDVEWQVSGKTGYIIVHLSVDGGKSYERVGSISNTPAHGIGHYTWKVPPNLNESRCRVKVQWTDGIRGKYNVHAEDESDADFSVVPGVAINFRDVPSHMSYGKYDLITFDLFDPLDQVGGLRFTWRVDDGSGYGGWADLPGDYDDYDPHRGWIWWMPDYFQSATCMVQVEAMAPHGSSVLATDVTPEIDISSPTVTLISPDGGVTLVGGRTYTVEWRTAADPDHIISAIDVAYSLNGGSSWTTVLIDTPDDGSEGWTVPTGINSNNVLVRVTALWGERYILADDISSGPNSMVASSDVPSVTLVDPNPPVDGGVVIGSGEVYRIQMTYTGTSHITSVKLFYSTDGGSTFTSITTLNQARAFFHWTAPAVDTYEARVKVEITLDAGGPKSVMSNHDFYIFDTIEFNRPPVAEAGPDQQAVEGDVIALDASASYDPDGDTIAYHWTQIQPNFLTAELSDFHHVSPTFVVELHHFPVTFVFEVSVSDGYDHTDWPILYNTSRITVEVEPKPPVLLAVSPDTGWAGTTLQLHGREMKGAEVLMGTQVIHTIPTEAVVGNPDPDRDYNLTLPPSVPLGKHHVTIRTLAGEDTSTGEIEIFPVPQWNYDHGLGFHNPTRHTLSYPWNPFGDHDGRYYDAFGDQVYLSIWICLGIPYWTLSGWKCWGYLVKEPFAPDPLAAIFYGAVFHWIARHGECFGMSTNALRFYHGHQSIHQFDPPPGSTSPSDLPIEGPVRKAVDWRQGAQMSAQVLNTYLNNLIDGLIPSSDVSGMGVLLNTMKGYIDSGEMGICTMICDHGAHAVVPYAYEDDGHTARLYVYDCNREEYSDEETAIQECLEAGSANDNPPYIEIVREGVYWDWSFRSVDGNLWKSPVGLAYVPYHVINGDRTLPLSIEGIITLLAGDAGVAVEDEEGNQVGVDEDGSIMWGDIEGAAPMPLFSAEGQLPQSWYLPTAEEYTTHIRGTQDGSYTWAVVNNGTSALTISGDVQEGSYDKASMDFDAGLELSGKFTYSTTDDEKAYGGSIVHRYDERYRIFNVSTTLTDKGPHTVGTNGNYTGLVFTNGADEPAVIDVVFSTNVVSEAEWNGTSPPVGPYLPSAGREGIVVGPGETVEVRPLDWLNLSTSLVIVEGEGLPWAPEDLAGEPSQGRVTLTWNPPEWDGGLPISSYVVYKGTSPDVLGEVATVLTGTTYEDDQVEPGADYYYKVMAINYLGEGPSTETLHVHVPTAPGAPRDLLVERAKGTITLTWAPPDDDGGSAIVGYRVHRGVAPTDLDEVASLAVVTTWVDEAVKRGVTYYYEVYAVNAVGSGTASDQASMKVPRKRDDGEGGLPWTVLLGIVVVVLVAIAVAALMMRRRGGPEASAPMGPEPEPAPAAPLELPEGAGR